ncbi:hypothetical protein EUTSA_v10019375mg [Eutrema salsugineum]|uniref:Uncharacterized protein n=1 Tax=Eutrema salsugineum TaxID=72664 RepID=V4KA02_EUTSA|nr:uncharacterized protein LOC18009350 [Eutrema salsugineum]ESQ27919.1 hypothetical protein EUTSA_v10019375mg [Eutrema salsugineum]
MAEQNRNSLSEEEKTIKSPNVLERVNEEIEAMSHHEKSRSRHHKETHGTSDDIDENTAVDDVKGPGFFQRLKEEVQAIFASFVGAVTPKPSSKK